MDRVAGDLAVLRLVDRLGDLLDRLQKKLEARVGSRSAVSLGSREVVDHELRLATVAVDRPYVLEGLVEADRASIGHPADRAPAVGELHALDHRAGPADSGLVFDAVE